VYPSNVSSALVFSALHHVSVNKIRSGFSLAAVALNSSNLLGRLLALVYQTLIV
jgi:hypothetical protein